MNQKNFNMIKRFGLVGKKLDYSYSKIIHEYLYNKFNLDYEYKLVEVDDLSELNLYDYDGLNITIPYKQAIIPYLSKYESDVVNTLYYDDDQIIGYNTDQDGFKALISDMDLSIEPTITILGNGAMAAMIKQLLPEANINIISRNGQLNYNDLSSLKGDLIINTTPVDVFKDKSDLINDEIMMNYRYAIDLNYNPKLSYFGYLAKKNGLIFKNGLEMLVVQAIKAFELWTNIIVEQKIINEIIEMILLTKTDGIAFIGMPLSGKSYLANQFKELYTVIDIDQELINTYGDITTIFKEHGQDYFRDLEMKVLEKYSLEQKAIISCGGGVVLKIENLWTLKNHTIVYLDISLQTLLSRFEYDQSRPLLQSKQDIIDLYHARKQKYQLFQDITITENEVEALYEKIINY